MLQLSRWVCRVTSDSNTWKAESTIPAAPSGWRQAPRPRTSIAQLSTRAASWD